MNKVYRAIDSNTIQPEPPTIVHHTKYYGVTPEGGGERGFITRVAYNEGDYIVRCADHVTAGNGWDHRNESLSDLLNTFIAKGFLVYEFEESNELFAWVLHWCK